MSNTPDLISSADLRDCWTDRQLATLANARHRERMADLERECSNLREIILSNWPPEEAEELIKSCKPK